jgi:hypothetical protein
VKIFITNFLLFVLISSSFGQTKIKSTLILVPKSYSFLKSEDQYQLNSLTYFLLNKHGFKPVYENEISNNELISLCDLFKVDVEKVKGGMFSTKLKVIFKDCNGNIVAKSEVGESREKEFQKAYQLALRDAFDSLEYITIQKSNIIINKDNQTNNLINDTVIVSIPKVLYAQEIDGGFQLVDTKPKVVFKMYKTNKLDCFTSNVTNVIFYKQNDVWYKLKFSEDGSQEVEEVNIKF